MIIVIRNIERPEISFVDTEYKEIWIDYSMPRNKLISSFFHEIGHLIIRRKLKAKKTDESKNTNKLLADELLAWRVAKRLCPQEYFSEEFAIECLGTYICPPFMWKMWSKEKCIERINIYNRLQKIGIR